MPTPTKYISLRIQVMYRFEVVVSLFLLQFGTDYGTFTQLHLLKNFSWWTLREIIRATYEKCIWGLTLSSLLWLNYLDISDSFPSNSFYTFGPNCLLYLIMLSIGSQICLTRMSWKRLHFFLGSWRCFTFDPKGLFSSKSWPEVPGFFTLREVIIFTQG